MSDGRHGTGSRLGAFRSPLALAVLFFLGSAFALVAHASVARDTAVRASAVVVPVSPSQPREVSELPPAARAPAARTATSSSGDSAARLPVSSPASPVVVRVWHSFRDREKLALQTVATAFNLECTTGVRIELVAFPDENFTGNVEQTIPRGEGPDVFFWAHDKTGEWVERGIVQPPVVLDTTAYLPNCLEALAYGGRACGLPLAYETLILYYNKQLVPVPPASTEALLALAPALRQKGAWPLVYDRANFYLHAMWLHGFGGRVFDSAGDFDALSQPMLQSLAFARDLAVVHHAVPDTVDWKLQIQLFNAGRAGMLISGPWAWGSLNRDSIPVGMAVLPFIAEAGGASMPFLGVKGAFVSARTRHPGAASEVAGALTSSYAGTVFHILAGTLPAQAGAYHNALVAADRRTDVFKEQLVWTVPMPSVPAMARVWKAMMTEAGTMRHGCLDKVFLDRIPPEDAAREALNSFRGGSSRDRSSRAIAAARPRA